MAEKNLMKKFTSDANILKIYFKNKIIPYISI